MQAFFLESQWRQIYENIANAKDGAGNCLGGTSFEWSDEWWKHNENDADTWKLHDTESNWSNGSYYFDIKAPKNMNMNEEWFGIVAISENLENSEWHHDGIIRLVEFSEPVDLNNRCEGKDFSSVRVEKTFIQGLVGAISYGLYDPWDVSYACR